MAHVTWPGVQSSFFGGGEALIAQEPQPQAPEVEAEAEETPKETPADTPMKEPEEGVAAETGIDEDYVADVTMAQGTWDPWPILTQDTSISAQDAPTPPHDDPAPTQEE